MTLFVVGDLQGCARQLDELIERVLSLSSDARFIFVGDLVNRGPDSLACLRKLRAMGERAQFVLGNHDLHLLAVAYGIRSASPLDLANEVATVLRSEHWLDFLGAMYGNEPLRWEDSLQGNDRLRCIVNALTRLRFCTAEGEMEFQTKEGLGQTPAGYMPWFEVPNRRSQDTTIVFGHWSTLGLVLQPNVIGLDTGCVWGGQLSALRLHDRALIQVDCPQHQKPG